MTIDEIEILLWSSGAVATCRRSICNVCVIWFSNISCFIYHGNVANYFVYLSMLRFKVTPSICLQFSMYPVPD